MRAFEMLMLVVGTVLGWILKHALWGVAAGLLLPLKVLAFFRGHRFVWLEYAAWAVTIDAWGRFINDARLEEIGRAHV